MYERQLSSISRTLIKSASSYAHRRYYYPLLSVERVIVLLRGARGIGKTTSLLQYLNEQEKGGARCFYLSLDTSLLPPDSLFEVLEEQVARGVTIIALDEVHRMDEWDAHLKPSMMRFRGCVFSPLAHHHSSSGKPILADGRLRSRALD